MDLLEVFGVKESYKLPDAIMDRLFSDRCVETLAEIRKSGITNIRDYYQEEQGDRKKLKQDFTPDGICRIVSGMMLDGSKGQTVQFSAGTQARYLRSVKMFFRWTADEKLYPNIADNIKGAKVGTGKKRDAFTESEAETILNSIDRTTPAGKRDYAMLFLTFTAGLRIIEMQRATIADLETRNSIHKLWILGKGRDEKESVEVPQEVFCAIMEYLDTRTHRTGDAALFAGTGNRNNEQALSEPSISRFLKQRIKDAGFDSHRLTPHSARHTCGTIAARHGMPPRQVQALLRHKNFSTTEQNYLHDMENQNFHSEQTVCDILMHKEQSAAEQAQNLLRSMTTAQIVALMPVLQAASMQNMTTV